MARAVAIPVPGVKVAREPKATPEVLVTVITPVDGTIVASPDMVKPAKAPALLYWI